MQSAGGVDAVKEQFRRSDKAGQGVISQDALAELIKRLCGDAISTEVIQALFDAFHNNGGDKTAISYIDFIDWLFESLEPPAAAGGAVTQGLSGGPTSRPAEASSDRSGSKIIPSKADNYRLFCSHQHTEQAKAIRDVWLPGTAHSVKVSTPPFNTRLDKKWLPDRCDTFNIATYGARLPRIIMKIFELDQMQALSKQLQIPIPPYKLDSFVQKKMPKVQDLIKRARETLPASDDKNLKAVDRLEQFCKDFADLDKENGTKIRGPEDWKEFVDKHVAPGWEDNLHFDVVLVENFGFDKEVSDSLRTATIPVEEKGKSTDVTLEHHALRWLTKSFKGYGPVGCLTDVVNLLYAIMGYPEPKEASEKQVIDIVQEFENRVKQEKFDGLWIPTHFAHDAESDDCLAWLLLEYLNRIQRTQLEVLVQLPSHPDQKPEQMEALAKHLASAHPLAARTQVFRDHDSGNGKPVSETWAPMLPKQS